MNDTAKQPKHYKELLQIPVWTAVVSFTVGTLIFGLFIFALAFTSYLEACPYQKMAEVDEKLYSDSKINPETFAKISNLRMQGEKALKIGELSKSEEILDKALALFSNN